MAKESGLGWTTCSCDDGGGTLRDIINDVNSLSYSTPRGVQDITGIDKLANERQLLLADMQVSLQIAAFNDTALTGAHTVFKTVSSTSQVRTFNLAVSGQTFNNEVLASDYQMQRANSGELTSTIPMALANGAVPTWS